jgi:hypothetical protein
MRTHGGRGRTSSLSGRPPPWNRRRERTMDSRSRRNLIKSHGRGKGWLNAFSLDYVRAIHDHSPLAEELQQKQLSERIGSAECN